jgi:hypothetical protein
VKVIGKCIIQLQNKNYEFFVTDTDQHPLLGFKASNDLGLIQVVMTVKSDVGVTELSNLMWYGLSRQSSPVNTCGNALIGSSTSDFTVITTCISPKSFGGMFTILKRIRVIRKRWTISS